MTVRRLDPETGEIITSGQHFVTGQSEIAQTIQTRLRLFAGEYARDLTEGTRWFQTILVKRSTNTERNAEIRNRILRTPGVKKILSFAADYDLTTRKYTVSVSVQTEYGTLTLSEIV